MTRPNGESGRGEAPAEILIVGAGIVGVCCAAYLQRAGFGVTLIDRLPPGNGCSFGNAGNVSPGAIVPYSMPGTLWNVPRWLLDPLGPLAVRPAHMPKLIPWLLRWMRASQPDNVRAISRAMLALHQPVFEGYLPLLKEAGAPELIDISGQLYVSSKPGPMDSELARELRQTAGIRAEHITGGDIRDLEPSLSSEYQTALLLPDNGTCLNPQRLVQTIAAHVQRNGGTVLEGEVHGFRFGPNGPVAAQTSLGEVSFKHLVLAAGAWSNRLSKQLGLDVLLEAERGYHVTLTDPGLMPRRPVTNRDFSFATAPMEMGLRFAGTAEYAGLDAAPNWGRAHVLLKHAARMYPGISVSKFTEWMGCRPTLPDGLPIISRSPQHRNVVFAFGHSHFGVTGAPTTGRLVAELIANKPSNSIDLTPYSASRFAA